MVESSMQERRKTAKTQNHPNRGSIDIKAETRHHYR